jgi:hypothetical protein
MIVAEPEPHFPKIIQFWSNGRNQAPVLREAINAGSPNHIQAKVSRIPNGITIVQEQRVGSTFQGQGQSFALSSVQTALTKFLRLRRIVQTAYMNPSALSRSNLAGRRRLRAATYNLFEDAGWNCDLIKKYPKQFEVVECGKVYEWASVGDDHSGYRPKRRPSISSMAFPSASQSSTV